MDSCQDVYINSSGSFLPGEPVTNDQIEERLGLVNGKTSRAKTRILNQNKIRTRYYAIGPDGKPIMQNYEMAARAINAALRDAQIDRNGVDYLASATTLSDVIVPGFASLVQGAARISTCDIASFSGVCASSVAALKSATAQIRSGQARSAVVTGSEFASRHFLASKYERLNSVREEGNVDFEAEFLRWMLSDGAGALVLENRPRQQGLSLKVEWIDQRSHADKLDVCMYSGAQRGIDGEVNGSWADYPSFSEAGEAGMFTLRQDLSVLKHIVPLGIGHYLELIDQEKIPKDFDWFVCHYSSHIFREEIENLLAKAQATIPESKWFTNLYEKGNIGSASLYVLIDELRRSGRLKSGDKVLCMVPESGRFITAFVLLTVVGTDAEKWETEDHGNIADLVSPAAPASTPKEKLFRGLLTAWSQFENDLRNVPIIHRLEHGNLTLDDYRLMLLNIRQQVMEGGRWIAQAAASITTDHFELRSMFIRHSVAEHTDFRMLEKDFVAVGGDLEEIRNYSKNIGSEALSAWMFQCAREPNPFHMVGSMFIIEGLGQHMASSWAKKIKRQLKLSDGQVSFLFYHGANDENHLDQMEKAIDQIAWTDAMVEKTIKTAKVTARLYRLQLEELGNT